jgi:twitching motility protein PilJ
MFKSFNESFRDLSFGAKLAIGFGTLVALVVVIGATSTITTNRQAAALEAGRSAREEAQLIQQVGSDLQEVRRLEKDFLLRYENEGYQASYDYFIPLMQARLENILATTAQLRTLAEEKVASTALIELPGATPEETPVDTPETRQLDQIEQAVLTYQAAFFEMVTVDFVDRGSQGSGLIGTVNRRLNEMVQVAETTHLASVGEAVDELDVAFKQYQLVALPGHATLETFSSIQQEAADSVSGDADNLRSVVQRSSGLTVQQKNSLLARLDEFNFSFAQLVARDQEIVKKVTDFQTASNEVTPVIESFTEARLEADAQAQERLATSTRVAQVAQMAAVILALIAGVGLAAVITEGLTGQVTELKKVFRAAAIGNFDARAEVLSADELGQTADGVNALLTQLTSLLEETTRTAQERFHDIGMLGWVFEIDVEGRFTYCSQLFAEALGRTPEEMFGHTPFEFMLPEEAQQTIGFFEEAMANKESVVDLESWNQHKDGHLVCLQINAVPILSEEDEMLGYRGAAKDITAQKQVVAGVANAATELTSASSTMAEVVQLMIDQAARSAEVAEEATASANEGGRAVNETVAAMVRIRENTQETARRIKRLGEVSQEIGESVRLIEELSDRTTVLALNASIQAAAAGEAGRGFAVVAEEVQRLAERAAGATRQIENLVKSIQAETNEAVVGIEDATREVVEGSQLAQLAGERMIELNSVVGELANLIQHVAETTAQQTDESLGALTGMSQGLQTSVAALGLLPTEEHPVDNGDGMLAAATAGDGAHQREG